MFLCNKCHKDNLIKKCKIFHLFESFGKCEICGKTEICIECKDEKNNRERKYE